MNESLIERWNSVVKKNDKVYHLGDFMFMKQTNQKFHDIKNRLNGEITFIAGNHDLVKSWPQIIVRDVVMCHYPIARWPRQHHGIIHLYGHSHGRFQGNGKCMDVGVDTHNYYPWHIDEIREFMKGRE